jgi:hypothetical protein
MFIFGYTIYHMYTSGSNYALIAVKQPAPGNPDPPTGHSMALSILVVQNDLQRRSTQAHFRAREKTGWPGSAFIARVQLSF